MADPRLAVIEERLRSIREKIAVSSGKGGVGKSLIASTAALTLARWGLRVGLLDLDFTGPSTHLVLGIGKSRPTEEEGIVPPQVHGVRYMSIVYYAGCRASPLRGADASNALIELLAVTRWGNLDFLIIDMPPGIGDITLDVVRLIKGVKFLVVTTPSKLAFETVGKLVSLLTELNVPLLGVVENMKMGESPLILRGAQERGIKYLGEIPFDAEVEDAMGDPERLLKTELSRRLSRLLAENIQHQDRP
jgi:ATP-binding protein involved in chromosome partitioning